MPTMDALLNELEELEATENVAEDANEEANDVAATACTPGDALCDLFSDDGGQASELFFLQNDRNFYFHNLKLKLLKHYVFWVFFTNPLLQFFLVLFV